MNFLIEGNIGAGKSTFVDQLKQLGLPGVNVIQEPVDVWMNYNGHNFLQHFYEDQSKWTFAFQTLVLNTAANAYRDQIANSRKQQRQTINFFERSMYSPYHVFARQQFEDGVLCKAEMELLKKITNDTCSWIDYDIKGIIYVRTDPEITLDRMRRRMRKEDCSLPLSYLQSLHQRHEEWLAQPSNPQNLPVLIYENNTNVTIEDFQLVRQEIEAWVNNPVDTIINPEKL